VGSEMCIRDSFIRDPRLPCRGNYFEDPSARNSENDLTKNIICTLLIRDPTHVGC
jgi:hypothetical protein